MGKFMIGFITGIVFTSGLFLAVIFAQELYRLSRRSSRMLREAWDGLAIRIVDLRDAWRDRRR